MLNQLTYARYGEARRMGRARAGTAHSFADKLSTTTSREQNPYDRNSDDDAPPRMPPRVNTNTSNASIPRLGRTDSIRREYDSPTSLSRASSRQDFPRSGTASRDYSPERRGYNGNGNSAATEPSPIFARTALRPVMAATRSQDDYAASPIVIRPANPQRMSSYDNYTSSPTSAPGSAVPVLAAGGIKKAPPPPPPARGGVKKAPPPPPVKRISYQSSVGGSGLH
jgi:hypothetical protein